MPDALAADEFLGPYLLLLDEIAGSPPKDGRPYLVLDHDTGWLQTLAGVDAVRASQPIAPGGTTIAAQTAHAAYFIELLERRARGERPESDWPGSFEPAEVDEEAWRQQRERLMDALERFRALARLEAAASAEHVGGALAILVHTAYHLGAVRQMLRVV